MDSTSNDFQAHQQRLVQDVQAVVEDAQALLRCAGEQASDSFSDARARLEQSLRTAQEGLRGLHAGARGQAEAAGRVASEYVAENPWAAVGIAAVAGLLLGALVSSRR